MHKFSFNLRFSGKQRCHPRHSEAGFSLVELSAIIAIAAIILVGYLSWTVPAGKNNAMKIIDSQQKIATIAQAIESFVIYNKRLPCPANPVLNASQHNNSNAAAANSYDFDDEALTINNSTGVTCPVSIGAVPTRALGLSSEQMVDGWGRKFLYQVSSTLCGSSGCSAATYRNGGDVLTVNTPGVSNAAYVIVSYGGNGLGAYLPSGKRVPVTGSSAQEAVNNDNDYGANNGNNAFIKQVTSAVFDDIVFFRSKGQVDSLSSTVTPVDFVTCQNNMDVLQGLGRTDAVLLRDKLSALETVYNGKTYNTGDAAVLEIMWDLQEACAELYQGLLQRTCPAGQVYRQETNSCVCSTAEWSTGNC